MRYFDNDEFFAIVETKINHQDVNLISPAFITPGHYRSKVYYEGTHTTRLEDIEDQDIQLINVPPLSNIDDLNQRFFQIIILACNNLKADLHNSLLQNHREQIYSSLGIKNHQYCRTHHSSGDDSIHRLTRGLISKMEQDEIDWGLTYYFTKNDKTLEMGIHIELLHPECCCTFFIPVKCSKGISTTLRIKTRDIKHIKTYFNYSTQFKQSGFHYQRISSNELLKQDRVKSHSIMSGFFAMKLLIKRWLRGWRFIF